jgi:hypothetical protein
METIEEVFRKAAELPEDLQKEVADFVQFLSEKQRRPRRTRLRLNWIGALRDIRDKYTSVELQHKASDWRIGKASTRH